MTSDLPDTEREPTGLSVERPPHPTGGSRRVQMLRRSARTPVSLKAMGVGAALGPVAGFAVNVIVGGDDRFPFSLGGALIAALWYGIPMGAIAGALIASVRKPPRLSGPRGSVRPVWGRTDVGSRAATPAPRRRDIPMGRGRGTAGAVRGVRRVGLASVSMKLLGIGAAVGAGGGFLAGLLDPSRHGDPRWIVIYALAFGAPTGAMAGVFLGALRRPKR